MQAKLEKLEMLRGFAATYIVAHHLVLHTFSLNRIVAGLLSFGQEAVIAFFLLSGFVIYYSTHRHHDQSFKGYFRRRSVRIYPIFLISLFFAWALSGMPNLRACGWQLFGNVFMLQDFSTGKPGTWFDTFRDNGPLWSLSYEWWFYMMFFPLYKWVEPARQLLIVSAISALGLFSYAWCPNQISLFLFYFILWWSGVELARTYCAGIRPTFHTQRYSVLTLGGFCLLVAGVIFRIMPQPTHLQIGLHPILEVRHFVACFIMVVIGLLWSHFEWKGFSSVFGIFSLVAPISYAVYVFHAPIGMHFLHATWIPNSVLRFGVAIMIILIASYLAEIPMQKPISRWINPRKSVLSSASGQTPGSKAE